MQQPWQDLSEPQVQIHVHFGYVFHSFWGFILKDTVHYALLKIKNLIKFPVQFIPLTFNLSYYIILLFIFKLPKFYKDGFINCDYPLY